MADTKRVLEISDEEHRLMVNCMRKARNEYIDGGTPTEEVSRLMIKIIEAPRRRGLRDLLSRSREQKHDHSVAPPLPTKSDDFAGAPKDKEKRRADREAR